MRNSLKLMIAALCVAMSSAALADTTADDLSKIEAETLLLQARQKKLTVQAEIAAKQAEIASKHVESNRLAKLASAGDPVIRAIEGVGSHLYATLQLDNGSTIDATIGDVLPNGMKVVAINLNEVIVENRHRRRVRLYTGAATTPYGQTYGSAAGLPPLPLPSPGMAR